MTYPSRPDQAIVVITFPAKDVAAVRKEIQRLILDGDLSEAMNAFLFNAYQKLSNQ